MLCFNGFCLRRIHHHLLHTDTHIHGDAPNLHTEKQYFKMHRDIPAKSGFEFEFEFTAYTDYITAATVYSN